MAVTDARIFRFANQDHVINVCAKNDDYRRKEKPGVVPFLHDAGGARVDVIGSNT
jgi:hypothetical protein